MPRSSMSIFHPRVPTLVSKRWGGRVLFLCPSRTFRPPPAAGLQAADVGEALQFLGKVIFVQDRVSAVLHHLQRHCPKD